MWQLILTISTEGGSIGYKILEENVATNIDNIRKNSGLFCEVLAATRVESSPIKEVSMIACSARRST